MYNLKSYLPFAGPGDFPIFPSFAELFLTTKVVQAIQHISNGKPITEIEKKIINDGSELIEKIIYGSTLIEGRKFKGNPKSSKYGLEAHAYGLEIIKEWHLYKKVDESLLYDKETGFTGFFDNLYNQLKQIERGENKCIDAKILKEFFLDLHNKFAVVINSKRYHLCDD